ncbi:protein kinase [Nannocystis sp. RBIL2]|uniref:protein kinase domain-containing protein n=1 Tax=Nannocystis sp. RBIL2 TaxID=2996788 RepID=UPI00226EA9BB|nr:protein kinase [Nannocystis sp. RBIL2]MCY1067382.1 protein kinase [Nannocystis sp. RBIL2]
MLYPSQPTNERQRLQVLQSCGILDTEPEPAFEDIVQLATHLCNVPRAVITITDAHRQWFKAKVGIPQMQKECPRELSFCAHTILEPDEVLVVPDALQDPRFFDNPFTLADPPVRFYAGVPLVMEDDVVLGTLCVFDHVPHDISPRQLDSLQMLARQVTNELKLRRQLREARATTSAPPALDPALFAARSTVFSDVFTDVPLPIDTVAGRYRMGDILGVGGMGVVVSATDLQENRKVAIKFLLPNARFDQAMIERFATEARALMRVRNKHVSEILDVGNLGNGAPYIVMERLIGEDLDTYLDKRRVLPVQEALDYALQACVGVQQIHAAGLLHQDIKPSNLFLVRGEDDSVVVKVLDFGVARPLPGSDPIAKQAATPEGLTGSPQYMSPEQILQTSEADVRSDIWALGVVLYEMLGGMRPFEGLNVESICESVIVSRPKRLSVLNPRVSTELEQVVARCLKKDREKRFGSVRELAQALAGFVGRPSDSSDRLVRGEPVDSSRSLPGAPTTKGEDSGAGGRSSAQNG